MEKEKMNAKMEHSSHLFEHFELKNVLPKQALRDTKHKKSVLSFHSYLKQNNLE